MLGDGQEDLARRFAAGHPPIVHWSGVDDGRGQPRAAPRRRARLDRGAHARRARRRRPHVLHRARSSRSSAGPRRARSMYRDRSVPLAVIDAVVFDLDGVLIAVRGGLGRGARGVRPRARRPLRRRGAARDDGHELARVVAVPARRRRRARRAGRRSTTRSSGGCSPRYREHLPLIDGAVEAVRRLAARYPLGLASSSNRPLIDAVLELAGLARVLRGDRLLRGGRARQAGARRLPRGGAAARRRRRSAAPRSRTRTAASARRRRPGMRVIAIPNPSYPPDDGVARAGRRDDRARSTS